jgi:hypothetical protein
MKGIIPSGGGGGGSSTLKLLIFGVFGGGYTKSPSYPPLRKGEDNPTKIHGATYTTFWEIPMTNQPENQII